MFMYYEKFPAHDDTPALIQIVLSSNGANAAINWKNKKEEVTINLLRDVFKQVPIAERLHDENTKIWTFFGFRGDVILAGIESMITQGILTSFEVKEIEELQEKVERSELNRTKRTVDQKKFKDEDFFYDHAVTTTQALTGTALLEKLAPLLEISVDELKTSDTTVLKKTFRRAALKLHPDRNNGDGSKMSELNMLWNIFMQSGA